MSFIEPETSIRKTRLLGGRLLVSISRPFRPIRTSRWDASQGHRATSRLTENGSSPFGAG